MPAKTNYTLDALKERDNPKFTLSAFKKWLNKQNPTKKFPYATCTDCLLANAVQDILKNKNASVGLDSYYVGFIAADTKVKFEPWAWDLSYFMGHRDESETSIREVKDYLKNKIYSICSPN